MGASKVLLGGLSAILLVAVVVGVVAGVVRSGKYNIGDNIDMPDTVSRSGGMNTVSRSVESICKQTDYAEACIRTIKPALAGNDSTNPKEIVKAAVKVTIDEVMKAFTKSKNVGKEAQDKMQKEAVEDCQTLLQYAIDELDDALHTSNSEDGDNIDRRADDLKNWLSAVISYQETCLDGLTQPDLKKNMATGLSNATELTSNALAIVTEITKLISGLQKAMNLGKDGSLFSRRRLLSTGGSSRWPEWMSVADRRLLQRGGKVKPNVVVAKDGSGKFKTITDALKAMPSGNKGRYTIYVKAGVYVENVMVDKNMENVFMYGDGSRRTIVSGSKNFVDGTPTFKTATFAAIGKGFIAKSMGFVNTAGPEKHQAVALRVQSDMSAFFDCRMDAFQDTLYVQTHRQFYRNCVIAGTVDFIFGDGAVVIQNSLIIVRKPSDNQQCIVTAQGRKDKRETTGLVIHNCRIVPDRNLFPQRFTTKTYLGRPWKEYSRTVFMESTIGDLIQPDGWMPWEGNFALDTLFYAEYANKGRGASTAKRVKWKGYKVITSRSEALQFTVDKFIQGNMWIRYTGIPYILSLKS